MNINCKGLLTLETWWADYERLLEGVRPGSAELRSPWLQRHAPLGHSCHGRSGGLVECRLVVKYGDIRTCKGKGGIVGGGGSQVGGLKEWWDQNKNHEGEGTDGNDRDVEVLHGGKAE